MNDELLAVLASIDASLKDIAAFARFQHQAVTGEKVHDIAGYVRSENAGGALVHLYSAHPGLKFRVGAVYSEHFDELPFDASQGKLWDGEAAPSLDTAKAKGYFVSVPVFQASFLPTGAKTDAGLDVYRFSRVVGVVRSPAATGAPEKAAAGLGGQNGHAEPEMRTPAAPADTAGPVAAPLGTVAHNTNGRTIKRDRSLSPNELHVWLHEQVGRSRAATNTQIGAVHQALVKLIPNEDSRRQFQAWLFGTDAASMAIWTPQQVMAVHSWLKPSTGNGPTDKWAAEEVSLVLDLLRPGATHAVWGSSRDAAQWAVRMETHADEAAALADLTSLYNASGKPAQAGLFSLWEQRVTEMAADRAAKAVQA